MVKLEKLDEFENLLIDYNTINIWNEDEIDEYEKMKKMNAGKVTTKEIKDMVERKRKKKHHE